VPNKAVPGLERKRLACRRRASGVTLSGFTAFLLFLNLAPVGRKPMLLHMLLKIIETTKIFF
jgi:hypothetical protein